MHKNTSKHNQVSSVISPSNSNDAIKRNPDTVNYETQNVGSICTININYNIVNLCKENAMPHADIMKLGEYSF